jgi:hypothetical protein
MFLFWLAAFVVPCVIGAQDGSPPSWLAAERSSVYFEGCQYSGDYRQADSERRACQEDLLNSPFQVIIFSFVNGAVADPARPWDVDPFALDFTGDGSSDPWAIKGFHAKDFGSFAHRLRSKGKKLLFSIGGGDVSVPGRRIAIGRVFTKLWNQSREDSSTATRWAQKVNGMSNRLTRTLDLTVSNHSNAVYTCRFHARRKQRCRLL